MSLESLRPRAFSTDAGQVKVLALPGAFERRRPAVIAITNVFAPPQALLEWPLLTDEFADGFVVQLPSAAGPLWSRNSVSAYAEAIQQVIAQGFAGRPVVLAGISMGALVALAVHAPEIAGIVVLEPPLATAKLWPLRAQLRGLIGANPSNRPLANLVLNLFGVDRAGVRERRHIELLDAISAPVDVVLGDVPLYPERKLDGYPSLVDEAEREVLRRTAGVSVEVVPGQGHGLSPASRDVMMRLLAAACIRAGREAGDFTDDDLLGLTPITTARVAYLGAKSTGFARAYLARNPTATLVELPQDFEPSAADSVDVLVVDAPPTDQVLARAESALAANGLLICRRNESDGATQPYPTKAGASFEPVAVDPLRPSEVVRFRRAQSGVSRSGPMHLDLLAFAPRLMDIRTHLPTTWLRTDPDLTCAWRTVPFELPLLPKDQPKVAILQRPATFDPASWRPFHARAIAAGWLLVLEVDDHPMPMAGVVGREAEEADWQQFGYFHAVQTTTARLASAFRAYNPEVAVFPNAAFDIQDFPEGTRPTRVFYGAVSRGAFGVAVARSLASVMERFPDVEFVVVHDRDVFEALPGLNKSFHPSRSYEGYLRLMSACEVSLAPIEDRPYLDTKSDAKFVDASRSGALTIGSPTVYGEVIQHGENGFIARDLGDWPRLLSQALEDPSARRRMARQAWEHVRTQRMFSGEVAARRDWYRDLWRRRPQLDAALMARLPGLEGAVRSARDREDQTAGWVLPIHWVETSLGQVPVWGTIEGDRPLVLAIRGSFPSERMLEDLVVPGADIAFLHLPGFYSPTLARTSVADFIKAFDEVVQRLFAGRDIIALGVSAGALVALGLDSPEIKAVVAVEPFFSTAKLWPLIHTLRNLMAKNPRDAAMRGWIDAIYGYTADAVVDHDYASLLRAPGRPVHAIVGDDPMQPPRDFWGMPSLTDEPDRARLRDHGAQVHLAHSGHSVTTTDFGAVAHVLTIALRVLDKNSPVEQTN